jgi:protein-tyrosine phosphatase
MDNLFLSGLAAASKFDGMRLCVHECIPHYEGSFIHIPILSKRPNGPTDRTGAVVNMDQLNKAVDVIDDYMKRGEKLLVHCKGGVERSPLTLAWYLVHRANQFSTLCQAYGYLKSKRPVVSKRLIWLPEY